MTHHPRKSTCFGFTSERLSAFPGVSLIGPAFILWSCWLPVTCLRGLRESGCRSWWFIVMFKIEILRICHWSEVTQSCPTLCDPMDCSPPGFYIHGGFQARVLEWVAISFSRGPSWPRDQTRVSCIAGRRFTIWATGEALKMQISDLSVGDSFSRFRVGPRELHF